jgi:hypothetical protein
MLTVFVLALGLWGCNDDVPVEPCGDGLRPAPPQGVFSVTGDEAVYLYWYPNTEPDLAGYRVYRSLDPDRDYFLLAQLPPSATEFVDYGVTNGVTYYYALTAFDTEGLESRFNPELIFDTPRPEGTVTLWNAVDRPDDCGYDFSSGRILPWDHPETDIFFEYTPEGGYRIYAANTGQQAPTDIQDAGFVDPDVIDWAPEDGWSFQGWAEAIPGHTYVVWTRDDHYAKIFVQGVDTEAVDLYWAYQVDRGNQELSVP